MDRNSRSAPPEVTSEENITRIRDCYPFPIAYLFRRRILDETDFKKRVEGINYTFQNTLRYLAVLVLAEYAQYPGPDETLNGLIDRLGKPQIGDLARVVKQGVHRLTTGGHNWVIAEFPEFRQAVVRTKGLPGIKGSMLLDSLVALRNWLAHQDYEPNWRHLFNDYYPLLLRLLTKLGFLADYKLCRVVSGPNGKLVLEELMGTNPTFPQTLVAEIGGSESGGSSLFLRHVSGTRMLPLTPFMVMRLCEKCVAEPGLPGLKEEVFLLNGFDEDTTTFIGTRHSLDLEQSDFAGMRDRKRLMLPELAADLISREQLFARAQRITARFIEAQSRYSIFLPQVYSPRIEMEEQLEQFLTNDRTAFLLLGESGIGKTNLLCHWGTQLLEKGIPTLYYPAAGLDFERLEFHILSDLAIRGTLVDTLRPLNGEMRTPFVLLIDGLNENPRPAQAMELINALIRAHSKAAFKVVVCLRTSHFQQLLEGLVDTRLDKEGSSFFRANYYHVSSIAGAGGARETYQHVLTKFDQERELEEAYERYRNLTQSEEVFPARMLSPLSPFAELSRQTRDLMANPWYLRLVMETYNGREVPARIFSTDLLREYCQRAIYYREDTADFIEQVVTLMNQHLTTFAIRSELKGNPAFRPAMQDTAFGPSPYSRLIDNGVLAEIPESTTHGLFTTPRYRVQFSFDRVFEFLLANQIIAKGPVGSEVIQALLENSSSYSPFAGVVQAIWLIYALEEREQLILQCIDECRNCPLIPPLIATLRSLQAHGHPSFDRILTVLTDRSSVGDGLLIYALGHGLSPENGIEAQNKVFEILYTWRGEERHAFRFIGGSFLLFGYQLAKRYREASSVFNDLQTRYSKDTNTEPDLLRFEGKFSSRQEARVNELAWRWQAYGLQLLGNALSFEQQGGIIDEMLKRIGLKLPITLRHSLAALVDLIARFRGVTSSEIAQTASERMTLEQEAGRLRTALLAFDHVGLDLQELVIKEVPAALAEVETDLRFLHDGYAALARHDGGSQILENIVRIYVADREEIDPFLGNKMSAADSLIELNLLLAERYRQRKDNERWMDKLTRAKGYAAAILSSDILVELYGQLAKAAAANNDHEAEGSYLKDQLCLRIYLSLSWRERDLLCKVDLFECFGEYWGVIPNQLRKTWFYDLMFRCAPWLEMGEFGVVADMWEQDANDGEWEAFLRKRVYSYDKISAEQRVLAVLRLLTFFLEKDKEDLLEALTENFYDFVDFIESRQETSTRETREPGGSAKGIEERSKSEAPHESVEYRNILSEVKSSWENYNTDQRLANAAVIAVFPAFTSLIQLENDEQFCLSIGKEPETDAARLWIHSLIRCWCADVLKNKTGDELLRGYLKETPGVELAIAQAPAIVLIGIGAYLFWARLKPQISEDSLRTITRLSSSSDDLEGIVDIVKKELQRLGISANDVVLELKGQLVEEHELVLASFGG